MTDNMERVRAALADRYRIERELGQGGMATVYLAADLKHDRPVALKVLHPELAAVIGTDRFLAEIRVTANLQHPNILALFDSGTADGLVYYVMPFVEGESLRDRLTRERQLPVEDVVRIGQAAAGALAYAHRHGVIHRDIKPENILLQDNQPLVADFGIALAVRAAGGARLTQTGLSLGTPQYMSPEQAGGDRDLDGRTDVYSLGAVLYECLAGEAPFAATTTQAIIARLLSEEPKPLSSLRRTVPLGVESAVHKALAKLPADRFHGAGSFADALSAGLTSGEIRPVTTAVRPAPKRPAATAAIVAGTLVAGAALGYVSGTARAPKMTSFDVGLPDSAPVAFAKGGAWGEGWRSIALGPSGDVLYYIADRGATTELWQRSLSEPTAKPVPGTTGVNQFYVSPDGKSVAVFAVGVGRVVSLVDQGVTEIGRFTRLTGAAWISNTQVTVAELEGTQLVSVNVQGGSRDTLRLASDCYAPRFLEESKAFLCAARGSGGVSALLHLIRDGKSEDLTGPTGALTGSDPHWLDGKYLLWPSTQGEIMAAAWAGPGTAVGPAVRMLSGIRIEGVTGVAQFSLMGPSLAYATGEGSTMGRLVAIRGGGSVDTLALPTQRLKQFDFSRDGRRVVVAVTAADGDELWGYDAATGQGERWLAAPSLDEPRWSPDGRRLLVWSRGRTTDPGRTLLVTPGSVAPPDTLPAFYPSQWVREDLVLGHVTLSTSETYNDVVAVHLTAGGVRVDTLRMPGDQSRAALAPGGRWMAFMSNNDVVVEDYPARTRRIRLGPGLDPLWTGEDEVVYREGNRWHWVRIDLTTGDARGATRPDWSDAKFVDTPLRSQALLPDGRVAYVQGTGKTTAAYVRIVPDWLSQVRKAIGG